jgi:hypothetical protein
MSATIDHRERLIRKVARSIAWASLSQMAKDSARSTAIRVVDDLLAASAEGKACERELKAQRLHATEGAQ